MNRRLAAAAIAGTAGLALAATLVLAARNDLRPVSSPAASRTLDAIDPAAARATVMTTPLGEPAVGPGAAAPEDAVTLMTAALAQGDATGSFTLLASSEQQAVGGSGAWQDTLGFLPRYRAVTIVEPGNPSSEETTVVADVRFEPRLDEVHGYVPERATVRYPVVREAGGWRVRLGAAEIRPWLPDEAASTEVAQQWLDGARACRPPTALTYPGSLVGDPALVSSLCDAPEYGAGPAGPLETLADPTSVLQAFGGDAGSFTRVVRAEGPRPLQVVLAPSGDTWVVVGVTSA